MKSEAIGSRVSSKHFTFSPATNSFVGEIAEISHEGADPLDQLYHDDGAKGFVMVSTRTGHEAEFYLTDTVREDDGDLRAWLFRPTMHTTNQFPALRGVQITIVNT